MRALPAQPNFFTLACADVERMADFLRALGWPESPESEPAHRVFQCTNGVAFALYAAKNYEPHYGPRADGFRGFTIGVNLATPEDVDRAYELLRDVDGVELSEEPADSPHGFRGFGFRDPEGNVWEVAWKRGSTVTVEGDLSW
ncbi:MAG: VOC family protein [Gaiellaceae bacterium]